MSSTLVEVAMLVLAVIVGFGLGVRVTSRRYQQALREVADATAHLREFESR